MTLELRGVSKSVEGAVHIHPTDLTLKKGTMNVLLGPTLSGKTSLMRLMAGLDVPTEGTIHWEWQRRHGYACARAQGGYGVPTVHQLPVYDSL